MSPSYAKWYVGQCIILNIINKVIFLLIWSDVVVSFSLDYARQ